MNKQCPNCLRSVPEKNVDNHPGLIELNMTRRGYYEGIELDRNMYRSGCGIRIGLNEQGPQYYVHFGKVICPFHKVLATPASVTFSPDFSYTSVDYYCTANGHRIEVTPLLKVDGVEQEAV